MRVGIAGLDEQPRIEAATVGIAGDGRAVFDAARFGIAGVNGNNIIETAKFGISGLDRPSKTGLIAPALYDCDQALTAISRSSDRLGDRAARRGWQYGVWFVSYEYAVKLARARTNGAVIWKKGREEVFSRPYRFLPLFFDSSGYRREISGAAPQWARAFENYVAAIELADPDGFAAFDYPFHRGKTLAYLSKLAGIFPAAVQDGRLWPIFSIRWTWREDAHLDFAQLPGWRSRELSTLIPLNSTQRHYKRETRERAARLAIANALIIGRDPDFQMMCDHYGQVMLGGMVGCDCPRIARHLFAATLTQLYPGVKFWLLGQANFAVVNGLGSLGLLNQVYSDSTWYLKDATAGRFAFVEDGLITMHSFSAKGEEPYRRQPFFTMVEMMAANLRSLLAAYAGEWSWPPPEPLPIDLMDPDQAAEAKTRLQAAQLELGL